MKKYLPMITGLLLAAISIFMGLVPKGIAVYSGLTTLGTHMGYLWGAMIMAWVFHDNWRKSLYASFFALFVAYLVYYSTLIAFSYLNVTDALSPVHYLRSFVIWLVIAVIISLAVATAVWMACHAKSKLLNYGVFLVAYLAILGAILYFQVMFVFRWYNSAIARDGIIRDMQLLSELLYEIGFSFVVSTILLAIGLRMTVKNKKAIAQLGTF